MEYNGEPRSDAPTTFPVADFEPLADMEVLRHACAVRGFGPDCADCEESVETINGVKMGPTVYTEDNVLFDMNTREARSRWNLSPDAWYERATFRCEDCFLEHLDGSAEERAKRIDVSPDTRDRVYELLANAPSVEIMVFGMRIQVVIDGPVTDDGTATGLPPAVQDALVQFDLAVQDISARTPYQPWLGRGTQRPVLTVTLEWERPVPEDIVFETA